MCAFRSMGITETPQIRQRRKPLKEVNNRAAPETSATAELSEEKVEVSMKDRKMKVSAEAYRAYEFYQQYDDWASETEKTDYTYSRLSKYKDKEIVPGFRVRPNLSRSPIKASTPRSVYHYTAEREEQRQDTLVSNHNSHVHRRLADEEVSEVDSFVEQISWHRRLVEFFVTIYTTCVSLIARSFNATAHVLSAATSLLASAGRRTVSTVRSSLRWPSKQSSVVQGSGETTYFFSSWWRSSEEVASVNQVSSQNGVRGWFIRTITTFWSYTVTTITTIAMSASQLPQRASRNKYWLLLLLLPLLLGIWLFSDETSSITALPKAISETTTSFIVSVHSAIGATLSSIYPSLDAATSSLQSLTSSLFNGAGVLLNELYLFIAESAMSVLNLVYHYFISVFECLRTCMCYLSSSFGWWWSLLTTFFGNLVVSIWALIPNRTDSAISDDVLSWTESSAPYESALTTESHLAGLTKESFVQSEEWTVHIIKLQKKVDEMEARIRAEVNGWKTVEAGFLKTLNNYRLSLIDHRAAAEAASRRCCRWPCSTVPSQNYLSSISQKISNDLVQDTVAEIRQQAKDDIGKFKTEITAALAAKRDGAGSISTSVDLDEIQRLVAAAIQLYDADKTGKADYALESGGGRVVSIRCTKAYSVKGYGFLGYTFFSDSPSAPEYAIRPSMAPGDCWSFQGAVGSLVLELSYPVFVTGFTMEHISASLSPTGKIDSAPQHFQVWGLNSADDIEDQYLFGSYIYEDNGQVIQYFPVANPIEKMYKFVELKIISNHGHPDYTCLYRIRVHGTVT